MRDYSFWAVISTKDGGLVSAYHEKYEEVKAIFTTKELADKCVAKQPAGHGLIVEEVEIVQK